MNIHKVILARVIYKIFDSLPKEKIEILETLLNEGKYSQIRKLLKEEDVSIESLIEEELKHFL